MRMREPGTLLDQGFTPEQGRARDAVRDLGEPRAGADFRARLMRDFVSGAIPERPQRVEAPPWLRGGVAFWTLAPAAAAAVVIVGALLNRGPEWSVTASTGAGTAQVDGRAVPLGDVAALAAAIQPGSELVLPAGSALEMMCAGHVAMHVTPGTALTIPGSPGRWLGRTVSARLQSGEVRFVTGPRFRGARLLVATPEAHVEVTGTTLAVIREPTSTCVCVLAGAVKIGPSPHAMASVPAGRRRALFSNGRPPFDEDLPPMEGVKLAMFRERCGPALEGAAR